MRSVSRWRRPLVLMMFACAASYAWLCMDILKVASQRDVGSSDVAIVLGAAVWGEQPSPVFKERIHHAVDLHRAGRVRALVLTGGKAEGNRDADSVVASRYVIAHGVPAAHVFCEQVSRVTYENLQGARHIIHAHDFRRVLIVSDPLHMRRSIVMARDMGMDAHPSPTPSTRYTGTGSQMRFLFREAWYYGLYLIRRTVTRRIGSMPFDASIAAGGCSA